MCGLIYERNPGDTWAFTIIQGSIPVAAVIILIYFGGCGRPVLGAVVFVVVGTQAGYYRA